jgi:hypothetical protein
MRVELSGLSDDVSPNTQLAVPLLPIVSNVTLLATATISAVFLLGAWRTGQTDLPLLRLYLLLPLIGGLLALARLTPTHLRAPERTTLVYVLFCLALVAWGLSGLWNFVARLRHADATPFPSLGDLGYIAGGLLWLAAIWVLYEGVVADFLTEVEANSFLLSAMAVTTIFVLSMAGGSDLLEAIKAGGNTLQIVALAYPLLYGFNVVMLLRLVHGKRATPIMHDRWPLFAIVFGLVFLYLAQMAWSTTVILNDRLSGGPPADRTGNAPQVLYILAYVALALGVVNYPLPEAIDLVRSRRPGHRAPA